MDQVEEEICLKDALLPHLQPLFEWGIKIRRQLYFFLRDYQFSCECVKRNKPLIKFCSTHLKNFISADFEKTDHLLLFFVTRMTQAQICPFQGTAYVANMIKSGDCISSSDVQIMVQILLILLLQYISALKPHQICQELLPIKRKQSLSRHVNYCQIVSNEKSILIVLLWYKQSIRSTCKHDTPQTSIRQICESDEFS